MAVLTVGEALKCRVREPLISEAKPLIMSWWTDYFNVMDGRTPANFVIAGPCKGQEVQGWTPKADKKPEELLGDFYQGWTRETILVGGESLEFVGVEVELKAGMSKRLKLVFKVRGVMGDPVGTERILVFNSPNVNDVKHQASGMLLHDHIQQFMGETMSNMPLEQYMLRAGEIKAEAERKRVQEQVATMTKQYSTWGGW